MPDQNQGLRTRAPWSSNNSNADRTAQSNPVSPLATSQEDFEEHECDDCPRQSGRTPGYWLILVFFVGPFYVIPPLSWANVLYTVARLQQQQIAWRDLCTWRCSVLIYSGFEVGCNLRGLMSKPLTVKTCADSASSRFTTSSCAGRSPK